MSQIEAETHQLNQFMPIFAITEKTINFMP